MRPIFKSTGSGASPEVKVIYVAWASAQCVMHHRSGRYGSAGLAGVGFTPAG